MAPGMQNLFDSLDEWMPGDTDNFSCPQCGHEDDVNGFLFLQPCKGIFLFYTYQRV